MTKYYIAIDIGASGGRHIAGWIEDGRLRTREIYRFEHAPVTKNGRQVWDTAVMFRHITEGLKRCGEEGIIPESVGIDTWGVDYALLDKDNNLIGDVICYRDCRTDAVISKVYEIIPQEELYARTGIAEQKFNTIFQLYADKLEGRLEKAERMLLVADYFHFLLTGVKSNEYTLATTTGLVNAATRDWDWEIINRLGYPRTMFGEISMPGTTLGKKVVLPCAHDTASAVLAVPNPDPLYISSGTWSLMGVNLNKARTDEESRQLGYTNEGGYGGKVRYLKIIMGLWLIQCMRRDMRGKYDFDGMVAAAKKAETQSVIDVGDKRFYNPPDMIEAINSYIADTGQVPLKTDGEMFFCVYNSLALAYTAAAKEIEQLTCKTYDTINIVGGGSKNTFLNELIDKHSNKKVVAGPFEATAEGNLIAQIMGIKT